MGLVAMLVFLISVGLAAASFAGMTAQARNLTQAHNLSAAVASAYEQWTLDDDQSNMYGAIIALRERKQHALAETTYQQAVQARAAADPYLAAAARLAASPAERALLDRIKGDLTSYDGFTHLLRQQALAGNVQRAIHVVTVENLQPSNDLPLAFAALENLANSEVQHAQAAINASAASGTRLLLILAVAGLAITVTLTVLIVRAITRPLGQLTASACWAQRGSLRAMVSHQQRMAGAAAAIAAGDLSRDVTPAGADDTLGQAFATMVANLRDLIGQVRDSATQVDSGAAQLSHAAEQLDRPAHRSPALLKRWRAAQASRARARRQRWGRSEGWPWP